MTPRKPPISAPDKLVENGKINFGTFDAPPRVVNMLDADVFKQDFLNTRQIKKSRLKRWQFFMFVHPEITFGFLVIDMGFLASSFFYAFDRKTNQFCEHKRIKLDGKFDVSDSLWNGKTFFHDKKYRIDVENRLDKNRHFVKADIMGDGSSPAMLADVTVLQEPAFVKPLVVSLPFGENRGMYSHKVSCPVEGTFSIGERDFTLDPKRDTCVIDEHRGFYPRHTYWKWATFGTIGRDGKILGVQVTNNLIKDQEKWNENAIWSGGNVSLLGPVDFSFDLRNYMNEWKIKDREGRVDLSFKPLGVKEDRTNALIIKTHYLQPMGHFSGYLIDDSGERHKIKDAFGVTEYHDAYF